MSPGRKDEKRSKLDKSLDLLVMGGYGHSRMQETAGAALSCINNAQLASKPVN
jgi:hypothetical protein